MTPETKFLIFYALSLVLLSAFFCWLEHRLHQRERK